MSFMHLPLKKDRPQDHSAFSVTSFKASSNGSLREINAERHVQKAEVLCRSCCTPLSLTAKVCPFCETAPSFSLSGSFNLKGALRVLYDGRRGGGDASNLLLLGKVDRDRRVVVKAARKDSDPEEVQTLREEIRIQQKLTHDHIVPLLYAAETPSEVLLVMPFAAGGDLYAALGHCNMLVEMQAARLCSQLLQGLRYLHQDKCVLHGDVKPRNIFLVPTAAEGFVAQLGDFGLARECPRKAPFLCKFIGMQGSHGFIAPEILHEQDYGCAVDIFALGIIVFTLLAGYEPFYPVSNITESPEWDECSWQELSKEAASFVTEALRKDPKDRITVGAAISHPWQNLFDDDAAPPKPTSTMFRDLSFLPASRAAKAKKAGYMPSASPHSEGHVFSSFGSSQSDWLS